MRAFFTSGSSLRYTQILPAWPLLCFQSPPDLGKASFLRVEKSMALQQANLTDNLKTTRKGWLLKIGRDGQIRTDDILLPKQALYQAELRPVWLGAEN